MLFLFNFLAFLFVPKFFYHLEVILVNLITIIFLYLYHCILYFSILFPYLVFLILHLNFYFLRPKFTAILFLFVVIIVLPLFVLIFFLPLFVVIFVLPLFVVIFFLPLFLVTFVLPLFLLIFVRLIFVLIFTLIQLIINFEVKVKLRFIRLIQDINLLSRSHLVLFLQFFIS